MFKLDISKFNFLAQKSNRELVGIDFSSNNLKLAHVRISGGKKEVVNLLTRNIIGLADIDVAKTINTSFYELRAKDPEIINTIPFNLVITKNIEIPSIDPKEIRDIINLQAGRHTPYSRDEIIVDYIDIGTYKHSYTKILLVIVARNVVKRQFDIMDKAGLRLEKVFFAPEGLAWAASKILKIDTMTAPVSIAHVDESFTDFTIVFKNKPAFVRSIPIGMQHLISEKERYEIRFADELKRSLEAYQSENIETNPGSLVLTGALEDTGDLEIVLGNVLSLPIKVVPYFKNLSMAGEALKVAPLTKRLSFFNVIASLLAFGELKVNLVPEEVKLRKALEERGKELIKTGILVVTVFFVICLILLTNIYFKSAYSRNLDRKYKTLNEEARVLEKDFTQVSLIKNYLSNRGYSLEVLAELYNVTPVDIEATDIRFDEQGKLSVRGTAESMSAVFSFVDKMEKSKYFKDVKTKYTAKRKEGGADVADFEITCQLEKGAT